MTTTDDARFERREAPPHSPPRRSTRIVVLVLAVLSVQFLAFGLWEAWRDAPTNDEPVYVAAGVTAWTMHDLRINNEHPPLPKLLAALPVLLAHPKVPEGKVWRSGSVRYTQRFVDANRENLRTIIFLSRLVPLLEGLLVGLGCYLLGSMLFGRAAGLVGAAAWLTMAVPLAFSHLNGLDVPAALFAVGGCLALIGYVRRPSWKMAAVVGVVAGLGLLTRWTAVVMVPVFVTVVLVAHRGPWKMRALQAASVLLIAWATVWGGYRIVAPRSAPVVNGGSGAFGFEDARADGLVADAVRTLPLPKEFVAGYEMQQELDAGRSNDSFIFGHYHADSTWWFWPATLLIKVPFPALIVLGLAPLGWRRLSRRRITDALLTLVLPLLVLTAATYAQAPQFVGVRYLLPLMALGAVAAGPIVLLFDRRRPVLVLVGVVVAAQLAFFYTAVPNSLSWTNPGFRPGYRNVADSSFDIGQEFYVLRDWSRGKHPWVWPGFGWVDLRDTKTIDLLDPQPMRGTIAINATALVVYFHDSLSWLRAYCPVEVLGKTILVFRIPGEPDLRPGPDVPPRPCPGPTSRRVTGGA